MNFKMKIHTKRFKNLQIRLLVLEKIDFIQTFKIIKEISILNLLKKEYLLEEKKYKRFKL